MLNVCLFTSSSYFGGTERMALAFLKGHDRSKMNVSLMSLLEKGPLLDEARAAGVPVLGLEWSGPFDPGAMRRFGKFLRENKIDLIHNFGLRAELVSRPFARRHGVRKIVTGLRDTGEERTWAHTVLDRLTARGVDRFIANSHAAAKAFIEREKYPPEKVQVIHNGLRLPDPKGYDIAAIREKMEIPPDREPIIVQLANYRIERKGYDILLEAAERWRKKWPKLMVCCVGKDFSGGRLARMIEERGLGEWVQLTHYFADVYQPLAVADMAVLASRYESFPVALLEVMASRLPVVSTNAGGVGEFIIDGENGRVIERENLDLLVQTVEEVMDDEAARRRFGEAAFQTVKEKFTLERMVKKIQESYLELAGAGQDAQK